MGQRQAPQRARFKPKVGQMNKFYNKSDEQNTKTNNKPIAMDESETQEWQE